MQVLALLGAALAFRLSPQSPYLQTNPRQLFLPPAHPLSDSNWVAGYRGYSGLVPVKQDGSALFYWLIERIGGDLASDQAPLFLWLQGGPGCSSLIGNLYEFGPFTIDENLNPQPRNDSWAEDYHLLFIDNPFGAGFSFTSTNDYVQNEEDMASFLYLALLSLCEMHPNWFQNHDFYIFGESYAGKYIPNIAQTLLEKSQNLTKCPIRLQGIGLGNAWVDPVVQTLSMSNYSHAAGLLSQQERERTADLEQGAREAWEAERYGEANQLSIDAEIYIVQQAGYVNPYNVRTYGNYDLNAMSLWLSSAIVKEALHVPQHLSFILCSDPAYSALEEDQMLSVAPLLSSLLDHHLKVLVYTGQDDLVCNILGTTQYLERLEWWGQQGYRDSLLEVWRVEGEVAGHVRRYGELRQVVVRGAGHMVPYDQLRRSRDLLRQFLAV